MSSEPSTTGTAEPAAVDTLDTWQAIWSPQHNAYYFYNSTTHETTWSNPLPSASTADSDPPTSDAEAAPSTSTPHYSSIQAAAEAAGIDPSLAYLDPTLSSVPGAGLNYTYTAKFNARNGTFAKADARDPTHLGEYERMKRMSEFYFDVGAWEREVEERKQAEQAAEAEGSGKKKKKPTKKDLVRIFCSSCHSLAGIDL
jgi:ribosomal protein L44E